MSASYPSAPTKSTPPSVEELRDRYPRLDPFLPKREWDTRRPYRENPAVFLVDDWATHYGALLETFEYLVQTPNPDRMYAVAFSMRLLDSALQDVLDVVISEIFRQQRLIEELTGFTVRRG